MRGGLLSRREVALVFGVGQTTVGRIWRAAEARLEPRMRERRHA
jgi:DNA invertase Pin-like site-specific DNA recombinase